MNDPHLFLIRSPHAAHRSALRPGRYDCLRLVNGEGKGSTSKELIAMVSESQASAARRPRPRRARAVGGGGGGEVDRLDGYTWDLAAQVLATGGWMLLVVFCSPLLGASGWWNRLVLVII